MTPELPDDDDTNESLWQSLGPFFIALLFPAAVTAGLLILHLIITP